MDKQDTIIQLLTEIRDLLAADNTFIGAASAADKTIIEKGKDFSPW